MLRRPRGCPVELPLGVSGPQWRTLAQSSFAMGSLPEGTMCFYCNQEEAGYIPDGLLGPTCGTCQDDAFQFGIDFIDRRRQTRFLHSLRAVTGGQAGQGRNHHFYHLFLDQHAELGYTLAPFLIWTSHCTRGGAAVAAQALLDEATEGSDDDNGFPPLWEDQWQVVMQGELGRGITEAEAAGRNEVVPHWTLDRIRPEWHANAYRALRTPHGRTQLLHATRSMMRARYETNQTELVVLEAEHLLRDAEENLRIMQRNLQDARRDHAQAVDDESYYDTGIRQGGPEPQSRLPERYESAWAILAWMTTHGPVGNLRARNALAGYYWEQLSQWGRFQSNRPREGEQQRWDEDDDWHERVVDFGPDAAAVDQHFLRDVYAAPRVTRVTRDRAQGSFLLQPGLPPGH